MHVQANYGAEELPTTLLCLISRSGADDAATVQDDADTMNTAYPMTTNIGHKSLVGLRRIDFRLIYTTIEACILRNEKNQTASKSVAYSVEEESMSNRSLPSCFVKQATSNLIALSCLTLSGLAAADTFGPVPKAVCGPGDHPETALQGQVPAALRAAGFQGRAA